MSRPRIQITLIDQKGTKGCHRGHKIGDSYDFDTERGNLCPMAMHVAFPYVDILRFGGEIPGNPKGTAIFACPDVDTLNVFKFERIDEKYILPSLHAMLHINTIYGVVRALNQLLNDIILLLGMHHTVVHGFCGNRDHINTLCDVQLSGLAVAQSVVIIHTISNIAALLGL